MFRGACPVATADIRDCEKDILQNSDSDSSSLCIPADFFLEVLFNRLAGIDVFILFV